MAEQPSSLPSSIPQGTPSAPPQTPPSFGAQLLGNKEYSVELNDAVMETQAWRNSRYNGQQLEAVKINKFTGGDKTYGKTPVIEKYSRNIYVGSRVVGYDGTPTVDNPNPGFFKKSYINVEGYFTINSDDTVSKVGVNFRDINSRKGFERSFREDFNPGSQASLIILDKGVEHNLKDSYTVDYNEGLLSRILNISGSSFSDMFTFIADSSAVNSDGAIIPASYLGITVTNDSLSTTTFTLFKNNQSSYYTNISGSGTSVITSGSVGEPLSAFISSSKTNYFESPSENKFFIGINTPTPYRFNTFSKGLNQVNVFELDMNTIFSYGSGLQINSRLKGPRLTNPHALGQFHFTSYNNPLDTPASDITIYKLNPVPTILINLIKEEDLPNGVGEQGFIVIPENFDPRLRPQINKILKDKLGFNIEGGFNKDDDTNPFGNRFFGFRGS